MDADAELSAFENAQQQGLALLQHTLDQIAIGQSERDIYNYIHDIASDFGFSDWLRPPVVHIDYGSEQRFFASPFRKLRRGSVVQLHLQPTTTCAFANVGITVCFGMPAPPIVEQARELCIATCTFANHFKCTGELFVFAHSWCTNNRTVLNNERHIGYKATARIGHNTPLQSVLSPLWPLDARAAILLRRNQLQWYNPRPLLGIYAIQPEIKQDQRRAGFAELILITAEERRILGRGSLDELCQLPPPKSN